VKENKRKNKREERKDKRRDISLVQKKGTRSQKEKGSQ
jgi:hypothetical protein